MRPVKFIATFLPKSRVWYLDANPTLRPNLRLAVSVIECRRIPMRLLKSLTRLIDFMNICGIRISIFASVSVSIGSRQLIFKTSEVGMQAGNLVSMCSLSKSDKRRKDTHLDSEKRRVVKATGRKGIGFKSVFLLGNEVSIDSGYFHFSFRLANENDILGKLVPRPTMVVSSGSSNVYDPHYTSGTTITINIRNSLSPSNWDTDITSRLNHYSVGIMINANNLRRLEVTGKNSENLLSVSVSDEKPEYFETGIQDLVQCASTKRRVQVSQASASVLWES